MRRNADRVLIGFDFRSPRSSEAVPCRKSICAVVIFLDRFDYLEHVERNGGYTTEFQNKNMGLGVWRRTGEVGRDTGKRCGGNQR